MTPAHASPASADGDGHAVGELGSALQLNGPSQYVTFGPAPGLGATSSRSSVVPAHRRGRRHHHRHRRHRERDPAGHEGPRRGRDAGERRHELLPRHRRHERRARRRLRGHADRANHPITGTTAVTRTSGTTRPRPTTARPGGCTSTACSMRTLVVGAASRREPTSIQHAALGTAHDLDRRGRRLLRRACSTRRGSGTSPAAVRRSPQPVRRDHEPPPGLIGR